MDGDKNRGRKIRCKPLGEEENGFYPTGGGADGHDVAIGHGVLRSRWSGSSRASPRKPAREDAPRYALVMFIEGDAINGAAVGSSSQSNTETVRRLAEELELRLRTVREESFAANEELRAAKRAAVDQRGVSFDLGGIGDKQGGAERRTPLVPVRVAMATITTQQSL